MSDLSEALEWWEDTDKEEYDPHIETGMAAARNWHTLTKGLTYWFCFDVGEVFEGIPHQCESGSSMAPGHEQCNWILGVDARNWHTRSEPDYLAAAKKLSWWLSEAEWEDIDDEIAGEWIVQARSIVDAALTDTTEPETEAE